MIYLRDRDMDNPTTPYQTMSTGGHPDSVIQNQPLTAGLDRYLLSLVHKRPFALQIKTKSLSILQALEEKWPIDPQWEGEALELWKLATKLSFHLVDSVKAHYALIIIAVGEKIKLPPLPVGPALCASFDACAGLLSYVTIPPHATMKPNIPPTTGMLMTCWPIGEQFYHQHEVVGDLVHQHGDLFSLAWAEWIQKALSLLQQIELERVTRSAANDPQAGAEVNATVDNFRRYFLHFYPAGQLDNRTTAVASIFSPRVGMNRPTAQAGLESALALVFSPEAFAGMEEGLLSMATDPRFPASVRLEARQMAQRLKALVPSTVIEDAAFAATTRLTETSTQAPQVTPAQTPQAAPEAEIVAEPTAPSSTDTHHAVPLSAPEPDL
jgi:hypothetical protein